MKTLIQIGSNDGNDDFKQMCESLEDKHTIILVEANYELIDMLKNSYRELELKHDIQYFSLAIVPDWNEKEQIELYLNSPGFHCLSSLINRKSTSLSNKQYVPTKKINTFLKELNCKNIEELNIDTEGLDYELLLSLDIDNNNIKTIVCEVWPYDDDDANEVFKTGPHMLNKIYSKYFEYEVENVIFSGMPSLKFTKK